MEGRRLREEDNTSGWVNELGRKRKGLGRGKDDGKGEVDARLKSESGSG